MADEPEIEDGESEGGGKSKALLFLGLGVIVLIIGVAAFFLVGSGGDDFSGGEEAQQAQLAASTTEAGPTEIYDLKEFKVNLSGSAGSRILQMNISVESIPDAAIAIEEKEPQIRDAIILLASDYTVLELEGLDGKLRLRDDIHRRINSVLAPHKVLRVYFTDFLLQT